MNSELDKFLICAKLMQESNSTIINGLYGEEECEPKTLSICITPNRAALFGCGSNENLSVDELLDIYEMTIDFLRTKSVKATILT